MVKSIVIAFLLASSVYQLHGQIKLADTTAQGRIKWEYTRPGTLLLEKGEFLNAKRQGNWEYFDALGRMVKREKYKKGRRLMVIFFDPSNGRITHTIDKKGRLHKKPDCGCN